MFGIDPHLFHVQNLIKAVVIPHTSADRLTRMSPFPAYVVSKVLTAFCAASIRKVTSRSRTVYEAYTLGSVSHGDMSKNGPSQGDGHRVHRSVASMYIKLTLLH